MLLRQLRVMALGCLLVGPVGLCAVLLAYPSVPLSEWPWEPEDEVSAPEKWTEGLFLMHIALSTLLALIAPWMVRRWYEAFLMWTGLALGVLMVVWLSSVVVMDKTGKYPFP
jgi:hypothetical protein